MILGLDNLNSTFFREISGKILHKGPNSQVFEVFDMNVDEETLDPENWNELKALGHKMIDDMMDFLKDIRDQPVWQPMPSEVKSSFRSSIPQKGMSRDQIYEDFKRNVLHYGNGNVHPRFWGWVMGTGTPFGVLADMLASSINPNVGGFEQAPSYVETQVIEWAKEMLDYDKDASGVLASGGSMANLIGLIVARNIKAGYDIIREGVKASNKDLIYYGSTETHSSLDKAIQVLGIGLNFYRKIPVLPTYQIDTVKLREVIEADIDAGLKPTCLIGTAGTVNTGAIDDLNVLADLAEEFDIWFHVDGAFGALCKLSPKAKHLVDGLERADSIAFDYHKWMYLPFDAGCVLVKRRKDHYRALNLSADYIVHEPGGRGTAGGEVWYSDYSIELTRSFRALKVWMAIKEHGVEKYGRLIEQNINQAKFLASLIEEEKYLELLAPTSMNIVNFRYNDGVRTNDQLNEINHEIVLQLHEKGLAIPSGTTLRGKYAIRAAVTNHRSQKDDFTFLVKQILHLVDSIKQ